MAELDEDSIGRFLDGVYPYRQEFENFSALPEQGIDKVELLTFIRELASREDRTGDTGRCSGSVYLGDHEHYHFLSEVFESFAHANVLQRDMYPSSTKFEGEIVAMALDLFHSSHAAKWSAASSPCGVITSGGSESLMTAVYVYREWGRQVPGVEHPEIIVPTSAHVAIDKGAHYFGVKLVHAPLTEEFTVDLDAVRSALTPNTVAIFASAGSYPYGLVDPIADLGEIALEAGIGLHVDGCLGGFILPFGEMLGYPIPHFDFRVQGVTSISADTHKYGYGLKGTSVLLFSSKEMRRFGYFTYPDWPGGIYLSPGMAGSRSGGLIAATWASMVSLGRDGYLTIAERIFATAKTIRDGIERIPGLKLFGDPSFVVGFYSDELDIYLVNDRLTELGWRMNALQLPPGLHFCITRPNTAPGVATSFLRDLDEAVDYARTHIGTEARSGALYGLGGSPSGNEVIGSLLEAALDSFYDVAPTGA